MMLIRFKVLLIVCLLLALLVILNMVRKRALELKFVLVWIFCDLVILILVIFPGFMDKLAGFFGIQSPMNMIFFFGLVFLMVLIFPMTVALSRMAVRLRKLAQTIALLEDQLLQSQETEKDIDRGTQNEKKV